MNRPWMPLYVADYRRDTAHLSTAEHGAYLLLIMHYWATGGLPDDDQQLARIVGMRPADWKRARPTLAAFFSAGWKHKRIEFELTESARLSAAGKVGGKASGRSRREAKAQRSANDSRTIVERSLNDHANDSATIREALHSQREDSDPIGSAAEVVGEDQKAKLFRVGKTILVSFGITERRTGALIGQWLKAKNDPVGLLAAIQYAREHNVAEPVAYISTLVNSSRRPNGQTTRQSLSELAFDIAERVRERERAAGIQRPDDFVRSH
jgi:uncharacterized protein YdaU (DUF1376 family)